MLGSVKNIEKPVQNFGGKITDMYRIIYYSAPTCPAVGHGENNCQAEAQNVIFSSPNLIRTQTNLYKKLN